MRRRRGRHLLIVRLLFLLRRLLRCFLRCHGAPPPFDSKMVMYKCHIADLVRGVKFSLRQGAGLRKGITALVRCIPAFWGTQDVNPYRALLSDA